ncbi:hypothetical protein MRX96_013385 [Rhipicephalus microplus]
MTEPTGGNETAVDSLGVGDIVVFSVLTGIGYFVGLYFSFGRARRQVRAIFQRQLECICCTEAMEEPRQPSSRPSWAVVPCRQQRWPCPCWRPVATAVGVVSFVGHYYAFGFHLDWALVGIPLAAIIVSFVFVPLIYDLRVASVFQYLRMRFDNKVGITACVVYFLLSQSIGAVGIFSSAIAVSTRIGLAGTIYTALGGLRGVVWADCIQAFVMFFSPIVIIIKVLYDANTVTPPLRPMSDVNVTEMAFRLTFDITNDENLWSGFAGALPFGFVRTGFDQMVVQRFMAARTIRQAKVIALADCDPVLRGAIKSYDQIVPYYMMKNLADVPILRGLFLAGLIGASTSTVSSIVNSHAAIFYVDVVTPYVKLNDKKAVIVMRLLAFASGTIMTLGAIAVPYLGTAARLFMSFYCSAAGPFSGLFLLALSSPWVNAKGAGCSTLLVCIFLLWHALGRGLSDIPPVPASTQIARPLPTAVECHSYVFPLYLLSFYWISFIGALLTIFLGTALSLLTGGHKTAKKNVRLTSPVFLNIWKRFPRLRQTMTLQDEGIKNGPFLLQPNEREDQNERNPHLDAELVPIYKGS